MRPEHEWMKIPVPPLIDRDLFTRARAQLERNLALCQRNKKNEYLLAGKIRCVCGRTRSGEGPLRGKHLYYRCSDRAVSFPLPPKCGERSINARIADQLVWQQISGMMSSPELLGAQLARWIESKRTQSQPAGTENREALGNEIAKLKKEEDRYNAAYGAGIFTIEQLRDYVVPIRGKIAAAEAQLRRINEAAQREVETWSVPTQAELAEFARSSREKLSNLKFAARRAIVLNTVESAIGNQRQLQVYGHIPVNNNVDVCTSDRDGLNKPRLMKSIEVPFEFTIPLPPPLKSGVDYGFLPGTSVSRRGRV